MQAQATGSRRYGSNRMAMLALLIGALAVAAAVLVLSDAVALPFTSESQAVSARPLDRMAGYNRIGFLEQNVQLPDGILTAPAPSLEHMRFLEWNTWAYDGDDMAQPAGDYLYPAIRDLVPSPPAPAGILSAPAQSIEQMHFLEQNVWEYGGGSAVVPGLDDYLYLEEYVAGKAMEDARSTVPGIHRDEGFNIAPGE